MMVGQFEGTPVYPDIKGRTKGRKPKGGNEGKFRATGRKCGQNVLTVYGG